MACDHHTASASRLLLIVAVLDTQTCLLVGLLQDVGVFVLAYTADKDDRIGWEEVLATSVKTDSMSCKKIQSSAYLSPSGGILRRTTSKQLSISVLDELLVETHVLLLGQNGIVGLETVLLEQLSISDRPSAKLGGVFVVWYFGSTYPCPWISSSGFSRHSSSKGPSEAMIA